MKTFIFDTNVLLADSNAFKRYPQADLIIPLAVLEELDSFKVRQDELGMNAREVIRVVSEKLGGEPNSLTDGVNIGNQSKLFIRGSTGDLILPLELDPSKRDNQILSICLQGNGPEPVILVSNDILLRIKANVLGVVAMEHSTSALAKSSRRAEHVGNDYTGRVTVPVSKATMGRLWKAVTGQGVSARAIERMVRRGQGRLPYINEFVVFQNESTTKPLAVRKTRDGSFQIVDPGRYKLPKIAAKNLEQMLAVDLLLDPEIKLVSITGKAGTGKAQPNTCRVLGATGEWIELGSVKPGEMVIGGDGEPTRVLGVYPQGPQKYYEIYFDDGCVTRATGDHLWPINDTRDTTGDPVLITTSDLAKRLESGLPTYSRVVPACKFTQVPGPSEEPGEQGLRPKWDLWIAGFLLGTQCAHDGLDSIRFGKAGRVTVSLNSSYSDRSQAREAELAALVYQHLHKTCDVVYRGKTVHNKSTLSFTVPGWKKFFPGMVRNRQSGSIPRWLFSATVHERTRFLTGFFDVLIREALIFGRPFTRETNQSGPQAPPLPKVDTGLFFLFSPFDEAVYKEITDLIRSLGLVAEYRDSSRAAITALSYAPTYTQQLLSTVYARTKLFAEQEGHMRWNSGFRKFVHVVYKEEEPVECTCIKVDNDSQTYVTDDYIVTHNTLLSLAAGISQVVDQRRYKSLLVCRPVHPVGKDLGFLPGSLEEKLDPWTAPIKDNLKYLLGSTGGEGYQPSAGKKSRSREGGPGGQGGNHGTQGLDYYFDRGLIEVEAMSYIRGRSIADAFMLLDETQNVSVHELKTMLTRVGDNTKIVLTGDVDQIDNLYVNAFDNGLSTAARLFKDHHLAGHITLLKGERSELATLAAETL